MARGENNFLYGNGVFPSETPLDTDIYQKGSFTDFFLNNKLGAKEIDFSRTFWRPSDDVEHANRIFYNRKGISGTRYMFLKSPGIPAWMIQAENTDFLSHIDLNKNDNIMIDCLEKTDGYFDKGDIANFTIPNRFASSVRGPNVCFNDSQREYQIRAVELLAVEKLFSDKGTWTVRNPSDKILLNADVFSYFKKSALCYKINGEFLSLIFADEKYEI